jgi:hypothetical protein
MTPTQFKKHLQHHPYDKLSKHLKHGELLFNGTDNKPGTLTETQERLQENENQFPLRYSRNDNPAVDASL